MIHTRRDGGPAAQRQAARRPPGVPPRRRGAPCPTPRHGCGARGSAARARRACTAASCQGRRAGRRRRPPAGCRGTARPPGWRARPGAAAARCLHAPRRLSTGGRRSGVSASARFRSSGAAAAPHFNAPAPARPACDPWQRGTQQRRHSQHPAGSPGASRRARPRRTGRGGRQPARYDSRSRRRVDQRGQRGRQRAPLLGGGLGAGALARGTQHRAHADGARLCPRADLATRSGCWSHALGWREARACMPVGAHDSEQRCCAVRGSAAARPGGAAGPAPASP